MDKREIKEKIMKGWLQARFIIQVLGKPADYVEKALGMALEHLAKDKKGEIIEKTVHKAEKVKDTKDVYTTFAEIEILTPNFSKLIEIIFDYMPSSVEIVEPANFALKLEDANSVLNDLAMRLHQYDTLLKKSRLEINALVNKFKKIEEKIKGQEEKVEKEESEEKEGKKKTI